MAQVIWKYKFKTTIELPLGAEIVHVGLQKNEIHLWIKIDTDAHEDYSYREQRHFVVVGTGQAIPEGALYLGTVHQVQFVHPDGPELIWHVFERNT